ncbi:MAG: SDR family NAD(P)-dependent oxidoreductase [Candidatus Sphingomonas phytovorans]|nr:SDR family NAD(P)-dependent oxidoreductase [Sphingomonas sp.]WEK02244.1 MAG: SDR family NAD(P)-dependent oxidoreductase [Sphingomonas sp.]
MGTTLLVTGAAGALGRAVVARLVRDGHAVTAIDVAEAPPESGEERYIGGIDLTDGDAVQRALSGLALQGLVNIAGGFTWEALGDGDPRNWDRMFRINLLTAVTCCHAALPSLRACRGAIVNVGAAASLRAGAGMGAYAASKSGIARLTESLAEEEKDSGVRVNAVLPSIIDTPANRTDMPDADHDRWVAPDALAGVIAFLLSADARAVTGALLPVTGRV